MRGGYFGGFRPTKLVEESRALARGAPLSSLFFLEFYRNKNFLKKKGSSPMIISKSREP
jgi:hypothetical protein